MKETSMLLNGEMMLALLDDRKTCTRRVISPQPDEDGLSYCLTSGRWYDSAGVVYKSPYGYKGDRLYPAMEIPSLGRNYCADTFGRIWSRARDKKTWRILKSAPTKKGYLCITPALNNKYKTQLVHRLVAEAFYGFEPQGLKQVRHLDGDQKNNAPDNLDWGTPEDNWADRIVHGKGLGESHHASKLKSDDVFFIRNAYGVTHTQRDLAKQFKVSQSTIWAVAKGKTWCDNPVSQPPNMPRWASRIDLEITGIRVERVQDITPEDILLEGINLPVPEGCNIPDPPKEWEEWSAEKRNEWVEGQARATYFNRCADIDNHVNAFKELWDSLYAERGYGWDKNPFCWVVEFRKI